MIAIIHLNVLNKIKNIIGIGEKKQLYLLFIITIFSTLIEVLNIGLVIPLLTSIVNFSKINSSELVVNFFIFFDINLTKVNFHINQHFLVMCQS